MPTCRYCGDAYGNGGGHCQGGKWGGCCRSFASQAAFDDHRVGPYDGTRSCLPVHRLEGWRLTHKGWTNAKPMTPEDAARTKAAGVPIPDRGHEISGTHDPDGSPTTPRDSVGSTTPGEPSKEAPCST